MAVNDDPVLQAGSVLGGRYSIIKLLGEGDRKRTYLAKDTLLPRQVAIAVIKAAAAQSDPEGTRREAEALARAGTHENVVTFHDAGVLDGAEFLVFDFLPGGTFDDVLARRAERGKQLSVEEVMRFGRDMSRALAHVHKLGYIHRDVAPGNIWLDAERVPHLGDFDSVVRLGEALRSSDLPPTSETYAAPEALAGGVIDERTDLYSLGAVLFEALTGERPSHASKAAIASKIRAARPDSPRSLTQTVSRLLAEDPSDRPTSADEVLDALSPAEVYHTVNEGLIPWTETLPFPLASILWLYEGEPDVGAKVDYLLKFFEALAQFLATVLLSASVSDDDFFAANRAAWFGLEKGVHPVSFHTATFGTWVGLFCRLAESLRELRDTVGIESCFKLFRVEDDDLVDALLSEKMAGILQGANRRRNSWTGHGGVAGQHVLRERRKDLEAMLSSTRALLGWSFEAWTLVMPGSMTYSNGVFDLTATILTGPNQAFRKKQFKLAEALDVSQLYLVSEGNDRALELLPFVRIIAGQTGQDACYFYNRLDGKDVRWVSYHFHADPEIVLPDEDLTDLLEEFESIVQPKEGSTALPIGRGEVSRTADSRRSAGRQPYYEHCQRCGYPFAAPTTKKFCAVNAACDQRLREPGYRVPPGRSQDLAIRNATLAVRHDSPTPRSTPSRGRVPTLGGERAQWILQGSPKTYDTRGALQAAGTVDRWRIARHRQRISRGDEFALWISGPDGGVVALGVVTDDPRRETDSDDPFWVDPAEGSKPEWRIGIRITRRLASTVPRLALRADPDFAGSAILRMPGGGNPFPVTQREWEALQSHIAAGDAVSQGRPPGP